MGCECEYRMDIWDVDVGTARGQRTTATGCERRDSGARSADISYKSICK